MAIIAKLIKDDRRAERFSVELRATVRNSDEQPRDVLLEDLSANGFRMFGAPHMDEVSLISVGFSGIGVRQARITWFRNDSYGCEFVKPLSASDLSAALNTEPFAPLAFPILSTKTTPDDAPEPYVEPYHSHIKVALTIVAALSTWAAIYCIYLAS